MNEHMSQYENKSYKFRQKHGMIVTADAVMYHMDLDKYVFIRRGKEPFKGMLALAGGVVEMDETAREAVVREVKEETNLDFYSNIDAGYRDSVNRDPRGRTITFIFRGFCRGEPKAGDDAGEIVLLDRHELPSAVNPYEWAFDHESIARSVIDW